MADSEEIFHLLQIVEQAAKHGDVLRPIHDVAMKKLQSIAEEHKPKPVPVPKLEPTKGVVPSERPLIRKGGDGHE